MAETIPFLTGNAVLNARFTEAGTTAEHDPITSLTAVTKWPSLRLSNPNMLSEEFAKFEAQRRADPESK